MLGVAVGDDEDGASNMKHPSMLPVGSVPQNVSRAERQAAEAGEATHAGSKHGELGSAPYNAAHVGSTTVLGGTLGQLVGNRVGNRVEGKPVGQTDGALVGNAVGISVHGGSVQGASVSSASYPSDS